VLRNLFFLVLLFVSTGYAFLAGGRWEKWVAGLLCAATLSTMVLLAPFAVHFVHFETGTFLIDCLLLAALFSISLISDRYWPLWITALHGVAVLTHAAVLYAPHTVPPKVYGNSTALLAYPMQLLLVVATFRHRRKLRHMSTGRSWRAS
jgi:hypothetical protein